MKKFGIIALTMLGLCLQLAADNLYPILKKNKWGYMNAEGKIVIDFKYDLAQNFNEGYASVALGNMPCLIDKNEKRIIDTGIYQFIGTFSEGLVPVMDYKFRRFYLNNQGKVVLSLPKEIYDSRSFYRGLAKVGKKVDVVQQKFGFDVSNLGYKFAYMRKDGSMATDFIFDDGDDFENPIARFLQGTKFGLLNEKAEIILPAEYEFISNFNEGKAAVNKLGKFGFIDEKGKLIIPATYAYAKSFNEGLAAVEVDGKWGFIDANNTLAIQAIYDDIRPFAEGRAAVFYQGKWAIIDGKGTYIYQPYFEDISYFNEGICPVKVKGKWGAIDKEGKILVPFEFQSIGVFEDGIAEVIYKSINLYVNRRGEILPK
ncbi:MAG: WG repeat-containing protein [Bacteroidia bacterium]